MISIAAGANAGVAAVLVLEAAAEAKKLLGIEHLSFYAYPGYMEWVGETARSPQQARDMAIVLDTNVVVDHHDQLADMSGHCLSGGCSDGTTGRRKRARRSVVRGS